MMGDVMDEIGEGERLAAQRRRKFWGTIGVFFVAGAVAGVVIGFQSQDEVDTIDDVWTNIPRSLALSLVAVLLISFLYGGWIFYKAIDEVELVDNLWGSTAAYYAYATLFPLWWVLAKIGVAPRPDDWAIYFAALIGGGMAYGWRKWRAR
ncbi:MAG: hypothetical protein M3R03_01980 [Pseudomonadota bacterium]|nr:hypothetical protein [Pseudomonadota bacterium]